MEIVPTDLRVGNFLQSDQNGVVEVFNIQLSTVRCYVDNELEDCLYHYEDITGIPLTEEWLLKFGFLRDDDGEHWCSRHEEFESVTKFNIGAFTIYIFPETGNYTHSETGTETIFVHQLQNLYYALTGEELQYNEKAH